MLQKEVWKTITDFDWFEVSNYGRVRSKDRIFIDSYGRICHKKGQLLKLKKQIGKKDNYCQMMVSFHYEGKMYRKIVARLVAKEFVPNPNNYPQVNHKDENSKNNYFENLEWCTAKYNINYGEYLKRRAKSKSRPIDIYDENHIFIETLSSGVEVSKKYNVSRGSISTSCKTKIKVKKYYFEKHKD
jgi:hypothetical protein